MMVEDKDVVNTNLSESQSRTNRAESLPLVQQRELSNGSGCYNRILSRHGARQVWHNKDGGVAGVGLKPPDGFFVARGN